MGKSASEEATTEEIMGATFRALANNGYPTTTIADIAEEFDKSKSLLYYHYENKEKLLEDFLRHILSQIENDIAEIDAENPIDRLQAVLDQILPRNPAEEELQSRRVILEIRSQAPYHEAYQEQFDRSDKIWLSALTAAIEDGVEQSIFTDVNPRKTAELIYATAYGIIMRSVSFSEVSMMEEGRNMLDAYIMTHLTLESSPVSESAPT
ncbi:TetR/AcrR family transcriptional regulator [Salinarchaeum sp. IM2453]|uniref:TetR/AcrR family transcriptional regulator n=1 Tax=Salinarchaeum sp. IM2453 TaxID=2862870 RepID=UPI001C829742|nr:TetR/AcrR family transcriptional regulator [Salinarchaeum sp. IM2453]QZA88340.1 TetR/AcrR family transcriptional regulator [Salinarchaeum sp. IM2453]